MKERLQKIIARAGIASRRKAEQLILEGRVTVNGRAVAALGSQADPRHDHIKVDGKLLRLEPFEYYIVNKPRGVLSAASDPRKRPIVTQLVRSRRRLYPSGRLDFQSEGLIILTNDGELTRRITQAGLFEKVYQVKVLGQPSESRLKLLREGITIDGEQWGKCRITLLKPGKNCWYAVAIREGRNRQIRRMFEQIGHPVTRLRRIAIGPLRLGSLAAGAWRGMTPREIQLLKGTKD